ncbi:unnamed protein product [Parascedosporium putredinis]|uniref:Uncharacterized protein n=1 Tax=Parascedosporium putredinis TaxID=1442378 RepID=A0A9P1GUF2_9PEZI|nr:unnamed protein product [Parascedosporium putredinis]CAI7987847.1 unnamed protein product [Parascedosporium putredinis]
MAVKNVLRKVVGWIAPAPSKSEDGRDQWPSRAAFLLASMGGCAGMGNLLRYPSQVYNNHGLQWYIPYLMCVFLIAIPVLVLEIAIGQAYRGGSVVAFNSMNRRLKGVGLSLLYVGFVVGPYFVVILSWIMNYFRNSFISPLPWTGRGEEFYNQDVVANIEPIPGSLTEDGSRVLSYTKYPGVALVGETVGWTAFTWFLVWLCIFRGVGLTGRVVYFTMGLPIVMTFVLIGRAVSLENAGAGIKLYFAQWNGEKLANGQIWQTACGQVFFSTGVGFGYFTSYASYNTKHSNAVMDSILIVTSNVLFENIAAFAVFGVVGFLRLFPEDGTRLGSFTVGFLTLPLAITEMPGANFWAFALFFTLMVLGYSSAFAMLDAVVTLVMDTGIKWPRAVVVTVLTVISFLLSLPYCTQFGYYLLDGIDRWINDVALVFVVFSECVSSTTVYRWKDVVGQVGRPAFIVYNAGYFGGMVLGVVLAHTVSPLLVLESALDFCRRTRYFHRHRQDPDAETPNLFKRNVYLRRIYYTAFYSPLLRYIAGPILAIVFGFSYPAFYKLRYDPLHILGFAVGHIALIIVAFGFIVPAGTMFLSPSSWRRQDPIRSRSLVRVRGFFQQQRRGWDGKWR